MSFETELGNISKERFRTIANKLLKKRDDTRLDYIYVIQNQKLFSEYFDLLGYNLKVDTTQGVIGLSNNIDKSCRVKLRKYESIILLILRLLYAETKNTLSLNDEVVVTLEQVQEKYSLLKIKNRPILDKTTLQNALTMLKKYNIIDKLDNDITNLDMRIKVYPSIMFAVSNNSINKIYTSTQEKLEKYSGGNFDNEEDI